MKNKEEYLNELEEKYENLRSEYLRQHGYVEKQVCEKEDGGYIYNPEDGTYYKLVPISGSDKELDKIVTLDKKCNSLKDYKYVARLFKGFAIFNFIVGVIGALIMGFMTGFLSIFLTVFYLDIVLSVVLLGIAKIIEMIGER